jgi:hypothetical protein
MPKKMTPIVSLDSARARISKNDIESEGTVYWPVSDLSQSAEDDWINHAIKGTPHEGFARSIWAHYPNLKDATLKLAAYIGPRWPARDGGSLLALCIQEAVIRWQTSVQNGEAFLGRAVGVYLYGLTQNAADVARLKITGVDQRGETHRWTHFSEPLKGWANRHRIDTVCAEILVPAPSEVVIAGIRTHMVTHLASPVDTGYLIKHAAHG